MKDGFLRVAAATPAMRVADCAYNAEQILRQIEQAPTDTALLVFPELCLTGYTCGDLLLQPTLLAAAEQALVRILSATTRRSTLILLGLPVAVGSAVYNCAAVCQRGRLLGIVPKTYLPNYAELNEARQFAADDGTVRTVRFAEQEVPFGARQLFACRTMPQFCLGIEICEDLWVATPPSTVLCAAGATVIANLSASDEAVGKADARRRKVSATAERLCAAYVYASAGPDESVTDAVFGGHRIIAEQGKLLGEGKLFTTGITMTEVDVARLLHQRRRVHLFPEAETLHTTEFELPISSLQLTRRFSPLPFVPEDETERQERCEEILKIQSYALARRIVHTKACAVLGISGGLDSALALLVTIRAFDLLQRPRTDIHAVTMPCYGTTERTKGNALLLASAAGCSLYEIDIQAAVTQHLQDIAHDGAHDVTYENAQARERTQVLMDLANRLGGLVVGTGDLSELALGWATYNGDHMSMYGVNADVPKTLVRHLVAYEAKRLGGEYQTALEDILATPVSPELLPPQDGEIAQKTEDLVGPYELHDFFLYYTLRHGFSPEKVERLACAAFRGTYAEAEIHRWLTTFLQRFFAQQFKRSCLPDGPRIGSVSLSPRGDLRMPSDAFSTTWLTQDKG